MRGIVALNQAQQLVILYGLPHFFRLAHHRMQTVDYRLVRTEALQVP